MFAILLTVLCLVSVSRSAPMACEKLVKPLEQFDFQNGTGRWSLVALSLKDRAIENALRSVLDYYSVAVDIQNSSYIRAERVADRCQYHHHDFTLEGHVLTPKMKNVNLTGTLFYTSCADCMVLTMHIKSPTYNTEHVYLLSRRRQLEQKEMEEFSDQVLCLSMPPPVVLDPKTEFCPVETANQQTDQRTIEVP
uniref:Apolipoprotein M n=1 Tax=Neolamprologus brichardi TaxID=32507 RepID=A0A3Q4HWP9_NEOBR